MTNWRRPVHFALMCRVMDATYAVEDDELDGVAFSTTRKERP